MAVTTRGKNLPHNQIVASNVGKVTEILRMTEDTELSEA